MFPKIQLIRNFQSFLRILYFRLIRMIQLNPNYLMYRYSLNYPNFLMFQYFQKNQRFLYFQKNPNFH
jgi:hypothetical protein